MLPKKKKPTVTVVENKEKGNKKKTRRVVRNTAQDTIPYLEQYENGLYLIDREKGLGRYAFIWHLGNTDYRLLKDTEKQKRLDAYSAVFNTLPPDIHYEETYINLPVDERAIRDAILPPQDEEGMTEFEKAWRKNQAGFADRFAMQMTRTEIYLTLSYRVRAKLDNALAILLAAGERIQAYLSELGVTMEPVSVKQSLWLLHAIYNPYEEDTFILPPDIYRKGTRIRDYIAPSSFHFKPNHTELGGSLTVFCL